MMDFALEAWVSGLIELNKFEWMLGSGRSWKPGEKLKVLFAGYNAALNTGADVRVEEMLRQVRRILGPENLDLSIMTQNFDLTRGYFGDARQVYLPDVFPPFLHTEVRKNDGVAARELFFRVKSIKKIWRVGMCALTFLCAARGRRKNESEDHRYTKKSRC
jgi:hypothetical protein